MISISKNLCGILKQQYLMWNRNLMTTKKLRCLTVDRPKETNAGRHSSCNNLPDYILDVNKAISKINCNIKSNWFSQILEYNVKKDKHQCLQNTFSAYGSLMKWKNQTPDLKSVEILGWCVELLYSAVSIYFDIIEDNGWRQGKTCWHKLNKVGIIGLNDAIILENSIYFLMHKYFKNSSNYVPLMQIFHDAALKSACVQSTTLLSCKQPVTSFSMEMYKMIANAKTANYLFELPFRLAMQMAGINIQDASHLYTIILHEMGHLYQVQDDFLNLYGCSEKYAKNGSDIARNKCTWFAVEFMRRANKEQKLTMQRCYGNKDPQMIQCVKDLYANMELDAAFRLFEEEKYDIIEAYIHQLSELPKDIFLQNLKDIYLRTR